MNTLDKILAHNREFVEKKEYTPYKTDKFPDKKMVVISCMDTRLVELLPKAMTRAICDRSGIAPGQKLNVLSRTQRLALVRALKDFRLGVVTKRGFDEAIVTMGGVATKEIDPKTMRSKLVDGLSFAGEIIDADGYTGGFNLQIAWSTAHAAAKGI